MVWRSISKIIPWKNAVYQKEERLGQAYRAVFSGSPSREDQEIVLADLAYHSGFAMVTPPDVSDAVLRHREGQRHLFSRIKQYLNLSPESVRELEIAAREEAVFAAS